MNFVINLIEFFVNLIGVNTQHNVNRRPLIQNLDVRDGFEEGLDRASEYLESYRKDPIPDSLIDVFRPSMSENNFDSHSIFKFVDENNFGFDDPDGCLSFVLSKKALLLPDFISEFLQIKLHMYTYEPYYTSVFRECQWYLYAILLTYFTIYNLSLFIEFCLFINPYRYPFVLITDLVEPFKIQLESLCPPIFGVSFAGILGATALQFMLHTITDVSLTMPFLPSEATVQVVENKEFYVFSGMPTLWARYNVPIDLREDWFDRENFKIFQFYDKMYPFSMSGKEFLPIDLGRLKALQGNTDINQDSVQRMMTKTVEIIKSLGLTKEEFKQYIDTLRSGNY